MRLYWRRYNAGVPKLANLLLTTTYFATWQEIAGKSYSWLITKAERLKVVGPTREDRGL